MQKILNNPKNAVDELLEGYLKCHWKIVERTQNQRVLKRKNPGTELRVGVVAGGGSGHDPAFIGYLQEGMLDAVAIGDIFRAPDAEVFLDAFRIADRGMGVICIQGNYELDNNNVKNAIEMAQREGIQVRRVIANDDVASMNNGNREESRGLAGEVLLWKIAGAAAGSGYGLDEIEAICLKAMNNTRSIGVGVSACIIPEIGVPKFDVIEDTMEFGIGHHGDAGLASYKLKTANEIAELIMNEILQGFPDREGMESVILVSGLGSTTQMELYILYNRIHDILVSQNIEIIDAYVGNYFTSLDMGGASVTVLRVDQQLKKLLACKGHQLQEIWQI